MARVHDPQSVERGRVRAARAAYRRVLPNLQERYRPSPDVVARWETTVLPARRRGARTRERHDGAGVRRQQSRARIGCGDGPFGAAGAPRPGHSAGRHQVRGGRNESAMGPHLRERTETSRHPELVRGAAGARAREVAR